MRRLYKRIGRRRGDGSIGEEIQKVGDYMTLAGEYHNADIIEIIGRRRRQILIHSVIYYRFNTNIIPDHMYDDWCAELAKIQDENPEAASVAVYADEFEGFDGSTGFDLPLHYEEIVSRAAHLIGYKETGA